MMSIPYRAQVELLLQVLPHVAKEACFALKGGTAINLFVRDMPRLSVDIDLTYLPFEERSIALAGIAEALRRIKAQIETVIPTCKVTMVPQSDGQEAKIVCQTAGAQIKIEVNTIMRGHLLPSRLMDIAGTVENEFRRFIRVGLVASGYDMLEAGDAKTGITLFNQKNPDLIILDLGLPDHDGKMVIATIRQTAATPILILSARTDEAEKIEALDLGADDYITKPFSVGEMMARIRAAFRHRLQETANNPVFESEGLRVDFVRRQVWHEDTEIKLSKKEYAMLEIFVKNAGLVVTPPPFTQSRVGGCL